MGVGGKQDTVEVTFICLFYELFKLLGLHSVEIWLIYWYLLRATENHGWNKRSPCDILLDWYVPVYQSYNSNNTFYRMYSRHRVNFTKSMQMYEFVHFNQAIAAVQLTEVIWTGNIVSWSWVWAFLVTQPSFKAAAVSNVMFSWKEFHLMPRLKMNGVLPPLPHVFMASHIISGTFFFPNSVTFATVYCLYLSVLCHCIYEISTC